MGITRLSCTACGGPIEVTAETERVTCAYCGTGLEIERSAGQVALRVAQEVGRSIEDAETQTRATIQQSTEATQLELRRLQLGQEAALLQMQLANLQAEIRSLQRDRMTWRARTQMSDLRAQERALVARIEALQAALVALTAPAAEPAAPARPETPAAARVAPKSWLTTFLLCLFLGMFGVHRFYTGQMRIAVAQFFTMGGFFAWWLGDLFLIAAGKYRDVHGMLLDGPLSTSARAVALAISSFVTAYFLGLVVEGNAGVALVLGTVAGLLVYALAHARHTRFPAGGAHGV